MALRTLDGAAGTGLLGIFCNGWTKLPSGERCREKKQAFAPNEMTSPAGKFESMIAMQILHRQLRTPAADWSRTTAPSSPLPLPWSPGKCPSRTTVEVTCRQLGRQIHRDVMEPGKDIIRSEPRLNCGKFLLINSFRRNVEVVKISLLARINCHSRRRGSATKLTKYVHGYPMPDGTVGIISQVEFFSA